MSAAARIAAMVAQTDSACPATSTAMVPSGLVATTPLVYSRRLPAGVSTAWL